MGRKSNSKQFPNKAPGKETNKYEQQKRKELAVLVDRLLKITSIFQAGVSPTKSWEHHLEIESILNQIQKIETSKIKTEQSSRQSKLEGFLKWLDNNGATYEAHKSSILQQLKNLLAIVKYNLNATQDTFWEVISIEISEFEGYEMGLKAMKNFEEGTLMLTVPRKLMMSEVDAKDSELAAFISVDPLLQNMPNITLALFLLLEKNKPDSFWKPYINILPEKYSTILYFDSDELAELKPSPVIESSLKLYRSIARQYAYFYNKIHTLDIPLLKKLQDIYTFENYRWAVSTVMTRQNNINLSNEVTTAFIPLWDMCNHEHGKITTDFNKEQDRGECYALRQFQSGEQVFIFYGARPNSDLFLHNGFVYPQNQHDSLSIALGISSSDTLREQRLQMLAKLGLASVTHYQLYKSDTPISAELMAFIRIFSMDQDELTKWSSQGVPGDLVSSDPISSEAVGAHIDRKAFKYLLTRCNLLRMLYKIPEDSGPLSGHRKNIKLLKECEVRVLDEAIKYLEGVLQKLPKAD